MELMTDEQLVEFGLEVQARSVFGMQIRDGDTVRPVTNIEMYAALRAAKDPVQRWSVDFIEWLNQEVEDV